MQQDQFEQDETTQANGSENAIPDQRLFIAFSNTLDWHASEHPVETLPSYANLVDWATNQGTLTTQQATDLHKRAEYDPEAARTVLERAVELREAIYRIIIALGEEQSPDPADLAILNAELAQALSHLILIQNERTFHFGWGSIEGALDAMLWPVARSAAEQLVAEDVNRVKVCADDRGCGYMFYDATRNRSRRWCDMGSCGNRAKAQRHYKRHRAERH